MLSTFYIRNSDQVSKGSLDHPNRKFSNVYNLFSSPVLETFNVDLARRLPVLRILIFTTSTVTVTYYLYILGSRGEGPIWEPTGYEAPTEGGGRTYYMYLLVLPCANCNHITYYLFAVLFDGVFSHGSGVFFSHFLLVDRFATHHDEAGLQNGNKSFCTSFRFYESTQSRREK